LNIILGMVLSGVFFYLRTYLNRRAENAAQHEGYLARHSEQVHPSNSLGEKAIAYTHLPKQIWPAASAEARQGA